jgi:hypothetical protein
MKHWCSMNTSLTSIKCSPLAPTIHISLSYIWVFHVGGYGLLGLNTKKKPQGYSVDSHYSQFWSWFMCFLMEAMSENAPGLTSSKRDTWWWWLWLWPLYTKLSWWLFCFSWAKDGKSLGNLSDAMTFLTLLSQWVLFTCATAPSMCLWASRQCISFLM